MRPIPAILRGSTDFTACGNPLMARLDLPDGASVTVIRRTEAVTAAESGLLSAVQMAFADSQSVVAGSATVTSPAPSSGFTVMRYSRFGSMPLASWCGLSTRRAPVTHPPVTANARSRMVRYLLQRGCGRIIVEAARR